MKRLLDIGDLHCGHVTGLTHPEFDSKPNDITSHNYKLYRLRRKCYDWFIKELEPLKPIDILLVGGDAVDGKGSRSKWKETLIHDKGEQCSCAAAIINDIGASEVVMLYGTPYHVGVAEDWEDEVAKEVNNLKEISPVGQYDIGGVIVNARHYTGRSSIPHGRHTAIARDRLWNVLWADRGEFPKAQLILRHHVHYFTFCGDDQWLGVTNPSLQAKSRYGTETKGDIVHFGFTFYDFKNGVLDSWDKRIARLYRANQELLAL